MDINRIKSIIEALLFASADVINFEKLMEIVDVDSYYIKEALDILENEYKDNLGRGIYLQVTEEGYKLFTKAEHASYIQKLLYPRSKQGLSQAALEILSIIALRQPVTRALIEEIRGIKSDAPLLSLVEKNFVEELGRLNIPGKPLLYGTTPLFLEYFGLTSIDQLKEIEN